MSNGTVEQPEGFTTTLNKVCKLNKALYGLKQSSRQWYKLLEKYLTKLGFYPIFADQAVFKNDTLGIIILCHVYDLLVFGLNITQINKTQIELEKDLELTNLAPVSYFLGMEITRDRKNKVIKLNQMKYTASKLQKTVALSSCEAEYMALKEAIKEYLYLISVIEQLNITNKEKFHLFTDSLSAPIPLCTRTYYK